MVSYAPKSHELSFELGKASSISKGVRVGRASILFFSNNMRAQVVFNGNVRRSGKSGSEMSKWVVAPSSVYLMTASELANGNMSGQAELYRFSGKGWVKSSSSTQWKTPA